MILLGLIQALPWWDLDHFLFYVWLVTVTNPSVCGLYCMFQVLNNTPLSQLRIDQDTTRHHLFVPPCRVSACGNTARNSPTVSQRMGGPFWIHVGSAHSSTALPPTSTFIFLPFLSVSRCTWAPLLGCCPA